MDVLPARSENPSDDRSAGQSGLRPSEALLWLRPIRLEYERYALAADQEEISGLDRSIGHLRELEAKHASLVSTDQLFLREVALQLAFWDCANDGRVTRRSLAADDLCRLICVAV